jgi:hypothetical protein
MQSDPVAVVSLKDNHKPPASFAKIGRTESVKNNLSPKWKKYFEIDWFFESKQELDIQIYDQDNASETLNDDDFLGSVVTTLGAVIGGMGGRITLPVQYKGKPHGTLTLTVEQLSSGKVACRPSARVQRAHACAAGFGPRDGLVLHEAREEGLVRQVRSVC